MSSKIIFEKSYDGFEDVVDLDRDISEMWNYGEAKNIPGEFRGKVKVLIWYEPVQPPRYVKDMFFTFRSQNILISEGIFTSLQLAELTQKQILQIPNFGKKALAEIEHILSNYDLKLRGK